LGYTWIPTGISQRFQYFFDGNQPLFAGDPCPHQGRGVDPSFADSVLVEIKPPVVYPDDTGMQKEAPACFQPVAVPDTGAGDGESPFLLVYNPQKTRSLCQIETAHVHHGQMPAIVQFGINVYVAE
jgi:hypothetical protein